MPLDEEILASAVQRVRNAAKDRGLLPGKLLKKLVDRYLYIVLEDTSKDKEEEDTLARIVEGLSASRNVPYEELADEVERLTGKPVRRPPPLDEVGVRQP